MILFYSKYCDHCNMLLDTIKRHDNNKSIKLVSIDYLKSNNYNIDSRIHSVPALYLNDTKEYIFGKHVFDHLLLPGRGKLLMTNLEAKKRDISIKNDNEMNNEPHGFTITNKISQIFDNVEMADVPTLNDINFGFTKLENFDNQTKPIFQKSEDTKETKNLPSLEDILKKRELDLD